MYGATCRQSPATACGPASGQGAVADLAAEAAGHRKCQYQRQHRREDQRQQEQLVAARRVVQDVRLHRDRRRTQLARADLQADALAQQARVPGRDRVADIARRGLAGGHVGGVVIGEHRALASTQRLPGDIARHQYDGEHIQPRSCERASSRSAGWLAMRTPGLASSMRSSRRLSLLWSRSTTAIGMSRITEA
jgi:hypothetical protein